MEQIGTTAQQHRLDEVAIQDHSADYYLQRYHGFGYRYHRDIVHWMTEGIADTDEVLDAGCGTGIIGGIRQGLRITGIDLSPRMIALANTLPYRGRGHYTVGDVTQMPAEWTGRFDVVLCRSLLHHLMNHLRGLLEIQRVLKPGGRFICWETNQSWCAMLVRRYTQHGDRFSTYHRSFKDCELLGDVGHYFQVDEVKYIGFLAYPLWGFPDIVNFAPYLPLKNVLYPFTYYLDEVLSRLPWLKQLSWSIGLKTRRW